MKKRYFILLILGVVANSHFAEAQLDYKDVAHLFYSHCTSCHHQGGGAPMQLMTYSQTLPYASFIQYKLQNGLMPPWSPDTTYTRFIHERVLTQSEKNDILSWINGGSLKGDTTLAPAAPNYTTQYKLIGTPSLILKIPTFTSNATTTDSYVCFSLPSGLAQDRVLRAFEIVPGNPDIVHHVIADIDTTGTVASDLSGACFNIPGDIGIGGYAPGAAPTVFPGQAPLKAGIRIKAGSNLILQIHYPPGTGGHVDSTQIRLYFYPPNETGIRPVNNSTPLQNWQLYILPNTAPSFSAHYPNSGTLPVALSMFATFPHSHKVCKSIVNYAFSGTDTIPLVRIKDWDFMWQGYYTYPNLIKVPAGYKIISTHVYNNTTSNPNISNPVLVHAGTGTADEMLFDSYMWFYYQPGDETIDVKALLENDSLLNPLSVHTISTPIGNQAFIYPNPASGRVSVYLSKKSEYKVRLLNLTGQSVLETEAFNDDTTIDVKNVPPGLYIVEVLDTKTRERTTKKIIITK